MREQRRARWRREQQAAPDATSTMPMTNLLRGKTSSPTSSRDPPLLLLCAAAEEETPSLRQIHVAQAPAASMPSMSLSSLAETSAFLSSFPLLVGMVDTTREVSIREVPKPGVATPLFLTREEEQEDGASLSMARPANMALPLLLLCDQDRRPEKSLRPATTTTDSQAMTAEDMEMQLDSPSKGVRQTSWPPSTCSTSRRSLVRGA